MMLSRWLLSLAVVGSIGCGDDRREELAYLSPHEAKKQNAPSRNADCPSGWNSASQDWTLRVAAEGAVVVDADVDVCGNIYIGWNADYEGHVRKVFPDGRMAWERAAPGLGGSRTDLIALSTTSTGGVLASTWQGATILRADGELDPILQDDYFTSLRFRDTLSFESGWLAVNSGGVAKMIPTSSEPVDVLLGTLAWMREGVVENVGYVDLQSLGSSTYRALSVVSPDMHLDYVRQDGEDLQPSEDASGFGEAIIYTISEDTVVLQERIPIEDDIDVILMGHSAHNSLLLAYTTRPDGRPISKLWNGSNWTALGDAGFSVSELHALPNDESLIVGLMERGETGLVAAFTVNTSGRVLPVRWPDVPNFMTNAPTSSAILGSGEHILVIGTDSVHKDIRGEVLPLEL